MKIITHWHKLNRHKIEVYENDDEMPIENYVQLQKNYLIAAGVGVTIGDFDSRLQSLSKYVVGEDKSKSANEINNMRNLFWNIINKETPTIDAFSCVVKSINGKDVNSNESGIEKTTKRLMDMKFTMNHIHKAMDIKKK